MATSFSALKSRQNSIDALSKQLSDAASLTAKRDTDDRFWYPAVDKAGNGMAVIRFLPAPPNEDVPFVRVFSHSFQGPTGQWYIENCLTTLGQADPVAELNSTLWNSGTEANKDVARKQKRKLTFISNVYIVSDPANPENEGQVKLFRYGKKIFDKVNDQANPSYPDDPKVDVFDMWKGADFRMVIRTVDKWRNYDKSTFGPSGALFADNDEKKEAIWRKEFPLTPFVAPDQFKSYNDLKERLNRVLAVDKVAEDIVFDVDDTVEAVPEKTKDEVDDSMKLFDDLARIDD